MQASCIAVQKFGVGKIRLMFLKEVSFAHQSCDYVIKKYSKNINSVKMYNLKYYHLYSSLQCHMKLDSEIRLI